MVVTFLVFLPALDNGFVDWDDKVVLLQNDRYRGFDFDRIRWMFTTRLMQHFQPLTWMTYALDHALWGMDPWGYHLTSILLHAAAAGVFFWVVRHLLCRAVGDGSRGTLLGITVGAALAALVFGIHPLRAESVAWATERRDVTSGLFFMMTLAAYLRASTSVGAARFRWLAVSLVAYVLSLMGKASGMTLPFVLIVLDAYPLRRLGWPGRRRAPTATRGVWLEKLPYLALGTAVAVNAFLAQYHSAAMDSIEAFSWPARSAIASYATAFYVCKTFLPFGLSPMYLPDHPFNPAAWHILLGAAVTVLLSLGAIWGARRWPAGLALWAVYLLLLGPVSGLAKVGDQIAADRYTYLPCLSWAVLVGAVWLATYSRRARSGRWRGAFVGASAVALLALGGLAHLTQRQVGIWHDTVTLWRHALRVDPNNTTAYLSLANRLTDEDRMRRSRREDPTGASLRRDFAQAEDHLRAAVEVRPDDPVFRVDLAKILLVTGRRGQAVEQLQLAVRLDADHVPAHLNLGAIHVAEGRVDDAIACFRTAIDIKPSAAARLNLANALIRKTRYDEAIDECRRVLGSDPDHAKAHNLWGYALIAKGDPNGSIPHLQRALEIDAGYATPRLQLAQIYLTRNQRDQAIELLREGMELPNPDPRIAAALAKLTAPRR